MLIDRKSLWFKIAVPGFCIVAVVFAVLLAIVGQVSRFVQEDYSQFIVTAAGLETEKVLSAKASELTSAKLMGNSAVAEATRENTREALTLLWSRTGQHGIIAESGGSVVSSTLSAAQTGAILEKALPGCFTLTLDGSAYYCYLGKFPLWGWNVISVIQPAQSLMARSGVNLLVPVVAVGCLLMAGGIMLILKKRLNEPVHQMVSSVRSGIAVEKTGITELDFIGGQVNLTVQHLLEKTADLEGELQERARAEEAMRIKDEHISLLLNSMAEGLYGVDLSGICTFCNPAFLEMLGYTEEEQLLGRNIHELIHHTRADGTPYPTQECKAYSAHLDGKMVYEADEVFWRADGTSIAVEYWSHPIMKNGSIAGSVVTFIDISQRRLLEEQLLHSQKIESIGRLVGGIAHDFNNLLTPIIGYSELLKSSIPVNSAGLAKADQILRAAEKARVLIQQLLSFSRKQILDIQIVDLNQLVSSFYEILRRTIRENVDIRLHLMGERYGIRADMHQLEQVIMNLVVNAQDAIDGNGVITIETALVTLDEEYCRQHQGAVPGSYQMLTVTDNGAGMDKQTLSRIFEPFFTTKESGAGTGLGLATVYGLVKQHGGSIWVYSEPGRGSTFKCYFPVVEETLPAAALPEEPGQPVFVSNKYTILLVEDNDMARDMAHELLKEFGFAVIASECPKKALEMAAGLSIDLLITDVVMPGMTGPQLNERLKKKYPLLKTLYMSGYTDNVIVHHGVLDNGICFIQKPFTVKDFAAKVESVLKG